MPSPRHVDFGNEVWRAIYIDAMIAGLKERVSVLPGCLASLAKIKLLRTYSSL